MTVREAFSKAYGEVPDGATCHIGTEDSATLCIYPTYYHPFYQRVMSVGMSPDGESWGISHHSLAYGPDISDRLASEFVGFFGGDFDKVVGDEQ